MDVVHLTTFDVSGGAARATYRLHQGLGSIGVDSKLLVDRKHSTDPTVHGPSRFHQTIISKLKSGLDTLPSRLYPNHDGRIFSTAWPPDRVPRRLGEIQSDVHHLHWVNAGFLRIETLEKLSKPIVWTLHDMWAFTGGCHYSGGCTRFEEACGRCPALGSDRERDLSQWVWGRKRRAWENQDMTIVAPSHWLANLARNSTVFGDKSVVTIPNGIDTQRYRPRRQGLGIKRLGIPEDRQLIVFGSADINDPRKGFDHFVESLIRLESIEIDPLVVVFGSDPLPELPSSTPALRHLGRIEDEDLRLLYSDADVFVTSSIEDNLPNTVLESLACGTPVVAFDIGGIDDMVEHKVNGYLAEKANPSELAAGIQWVIDQTTQHDELERAARNHVVENHAIEEIAKRYETVYRDAING